MNEGETTAINNCTHILTDPAGPYGLSASEALDAFADLSLYTNAESSPMCAAAIRWAGFRDYVYGIDIARLVELGLIPDHGLVGGHIRALVRLAPHHGLGPRGSC